MRVLSCGGTGLWAVYQGGEQDSISELYYQVGPKTQEEKSPAFRTWEKSSTGLIARRAWCYYLMSWTGRGGGKKIFMGTYDVPETGVFQTYLIWEAACIIAPAGEWIYSWVGCRPACKSLMPGQSITCHLLSLLVFSNLHLVFRSWGKTPGLLLLYIFLRVLLASGPQCTFTNLFLYPGPCSNFFRRNIVLEIVFQSRSLCKTESGVLALCSV